MRKIRCPRCAVINMEGFTSFPYCAACGTRLPDTKANEASAAWRRPLRSTLWATVIGGAVLGLALGATHFLEAPPASNSSLVVYGRAPRTIDVGEPFAIQLILDRTREGISAPTAPFHNVTLRLPEELTQGFRVRSVQPAPDSVQQRGNGLYYSYASLPSDAVIQIMCVPLSAGIYGLSLRILADRQIQTEKSNEYYAVINVVKKTQPQARQRSGAVSTSRATAPSAAAKNPTAP